jgi:hypothetical protein
MSAQFERPSWHDIYTAEELAEVARNLAMTVVERDGAYPLAERLHCMAEALEELHALRVGTPEPKWWK